MTGVLLAQNGLHTATGCSSVSPSLWQSGLTSLSPSGVPFIQGHGFGSSQIDAAD